MLFDAVMSQRKGAYLYSLRENFYSASHEWLIHELPDVADLFALKYLKTFDQYLRF